MVGFDSYNSVVFDGFDSGVLGLAMGISMKALLYVCLTKSETVN